MKLVYTIVHSRDFTYVYHIKYQRSEHTHLLSVSLAMAQYGLSRACRAARTQGEGGEGKSEARGPFSLVYFVRDEYSRRPQFPP